MQSEPTPGYLPRHLKIADDLRSRIKRGELKPGDELPSAGDLAREYSVATLTARSALAVLRDEGLIDTGRGRPAAVRAPVERQRINLTSHWADEQKQLVLRPRSERAKRGAIEMVSGIPIAETDSRHDYEIVEASEELAQAFDVEPSTALQQRTYEMHRKSNGQRLSWSMSWIPLALIEGYPPLLDDDEEPWPGGHQHQLYTVGIELDRFRRTVIAVNPTPAERRHWNLAPGVPLLRIRSYSIDVEDRVVELSDAVYPGDRTEIEVEEKLTRWPEGYPRFDQERGDA